MQTIPNDHLLLSVPQLDNQHRDLIAMVNDFLTAADARASRDDLEPRMTRLVRAFQVHFDSEEGMMRSSGYPGFAAHGDEHRKLIEQMTGLRDSVGTGEVQACGALVLFVRLWTEQHITGADHAFAEFLRNGNAGAGLRSIGE